MAKKKKDTPSPSDKPAQPTPKQINEAGQQFLAAGTKLEQLVDALWDEFGGAGQLAHLVYLAYLHAKDGSMMQIRVMDTIMKLVMSHDSRHGKTVEDELDDMTDKQLQAIFKELAHGGSAKPGIGGRPAAAERHVGQAGESIFPGPGAAAEGSGKPQATIPLPGSGDPPRKKGDGESPSV